MNSVMAAAGYYGSIYVTLRCHCVFVYFICVAISSGFAFILLAGGLCGL
jgi:hypothetical protein